MATPTLTRSVGPFRGGIDFSRPAAQIPNDTLSDGKNCDIGDAFQIFKRKGSAVYNASAVSGTPTSTGCGQMRFSAASSADFLVCGDKFFEGDGTTWRSS